MYRRGITLVAALMAALSLVASGRRLHGDGGFWNKESIASVVIEEGGDDKSHGIFPCFEADCEQGDAAEVPCEGDKCGHSKIHVEPVVKPLCHGDDCGHAKIHVEPVVKPLCHGDDCGHIIPHHNPSHKVIAIQHPEVVVKNHEEKHIDVVVILTACISTGDYQPFIEKAVVLILAGNGNEVAKVCAELYTIHKIAEIVKAFSEACKIASEKDAIIATKTIIFALELTGHEEFVKECVIIVPYPVFYDACWKVFEITGDANAASVWADLAAFPVKFGHVDLVQHMLTKTFSTNDVFASHSASTMASFFKKEPHHLCEALVTVQDKASSIYNLALSTAEAKSGITC